MQESHFAYSRYLQEIFGQKTYKIVVSSGLTCPTRDGSLGKGGCAFCDVRGSSSFHGKKARSALIEEQIRTKIPPIQKRFGAKKFLAYFQSYTNTYSDADYLREIYTQALAQPGIEGLCVGTRPDCLPDSVIELLEELAQKHYISLELGVQSLEDKTLLWLERGHDAQCSIDALEKLRKMAPHVHNCAHFIFGSPTDSSTAARDAAQAMNELGVKGTKLHQLMVLEHTKLAQLYRESPFSVLDLDQYCEVVIQFVQHLSPSIYIERLCATASHPEECLAPEWSKHRWEPHNRLRDVLKERGVVQGQKILPLN